MSDIFDPNEFMEIGTAADFLFRTHDESGWRAGYELSQRYEKDSLDGELRSKWGEGTVITRYSKEDSCYRLSKVIKAKAADSVVSLKTSLSGGSSLYVGRRKNGIVTECVACKWHDGRCDEMISEDENMALRYCFPFAMRQIVYSKGKLENFEECREPYDSLKRLKPKRRTPK